MSEAHNTTPCPKCAVAVPIGYVKCPRCHAPMPAVPRLRRESMRDAIAGGTSVPEPETGGFPWLLAGVCAAAATAAVIWYVSSGGARAADSAAGAATGAGSGAPAMTASAPPVAPAGSTGPGGGGAAGSGSAADVEPSPTPAVDPRPRQRADAIAALGRTLAADRLWATVEAVGDAVVIRSSFCADTGVGAHVDAAHDQLAGAGFRAVRCLEKAGAPVWQRDL